jgi:hypothetical protein
VLLRSNKGIAREDERITNWRFAKIVSLEVP